MNILSNKIIYNQLRLKFLYKHTYIKFEPSHINLSTNLYKLRSLKDNDVLEHLYLLELLTNLKSYIKYSKRSYQS